MSGARRRRGPGAPYCAMRSLLSCSPIVWTQLLIVTVIVLESVTGDRPLITNRNG